jgi:hypothetical protein
MQDVDQLIENPSAQLAQEWQHLKVELVNLKEIAMKLTVMVKKTTTFFSAAALLTALMACGDETTNIIVGEGGGEQPQRQEEGNYGAERINIINKNVVKNINQNQTVRVRGDEVKFNVRVRNVQVQQPRGNIICKQYIHVQNTCQMNVDINNDGYIDEIEMRQACGNILLVLDNNVGAEGQGRFPRTDAQGSYTYNQSASLSRILAQLRDPAREDSQKFATLSPEEDFNLEERVLVIYGLFDASEYPESVARSEEDPSKVAIPISWTPLEREPEQQQPAQEQAAQPEEEEAEEQAAPPIEGFETEEI